ncbi:MAG: hypothetical protein LC644_06085, partial [Pseudonocardia sp.]|nr:hypothetical protein [Pseudonocardia sp.]
MVLIFLGEASACRQDGSLRLLSAACLSNCLQDRERSNYIFGAEMKERLLRAENMNLDEVHALAKENVY